MNTVKETILRYQIQRHDELPEEHKAALREKGIDPDTRWSLIYSCNSRHDAEYILSNENENKADWETFRIVDAGEAQVVERENWF